MKKTGFVSFFLMILSIFPAYGTAAADQEIISPLVKEAPVLDGSGDDAAWKSAKAYTVRDMRLDVDITLKSVHTGDKVFFYVSYPDPTEDRLHKPWVWNKELEMYKLGPKREDTFQFRWSMEDRDVDLSSFSDDDFTADVWYWKANRTDAVGYADDKYHTLSSRKAKKSRLVVSKKGKERFLLRLADEGTSSYEKQIPTDYKGDIIPQYKPVTPSGSRADVKAKGVWKDGAWTIEFARKLDTGHSDDVRFDPASGMKYKFGISIKSLYGESIDDSLPNLYGQGRISEPLYLILK
jgi:hypothetical protein